MECGSELLKSRLDNAKRYLQVTKPCPQRFVILKSCPWLLERTHGCNVLAKVENVLSQARGLEPSYGGRYLCPCWTLLSTWSPLHASPVPRAAPGAELPPVSLSHGLHPPDASSKEQVGSLSGRMRPGSGTELALHREEQRDAGTK